MAFWRREGTRVVVYTTMAGAQKRLARKSVRHLDREPDHNVDTWVRHWSLTNERVKKQHTELDHPDTLALVEIFCAYLKTRRKSPKTISQHRHNLTRYCLPYFVSVNGIQDPVHWPTKSVRLLTHLESLDLSTRTINTCNVSLRVFWNWLVKEGKAAGVLLLRNAMVGQQATPLNFTVTPHAILEHRFPASELRLLAILGFFFSLRPQEVVALTPGDFRAGRLAAELECCKVMVSGGLYGKFAVTIHRQRVGNDFTTPKVNSKGWVACFDEAAAREVVSLIKERPAGQLLFPSRLDWYFRVWRKKGYPGLTLKDLRRASLYWLGQYGGLPFTSLKNHARHADPSTTALYVRRPGNEKVEWADLDLDA